jgi:hypothetical protein
MFIFSVIVTYYGRPPRPSHQPHDMSAIVIVQGLPWWLPESVLKQDCDQTCGSVRSMRVLPDPARGDGLSSGTAVVEFLSPAEAHKAVETLAPLINMSINQLKRGESSNSMSHGTSTTINVRLVSQAEFVVLTTTHSMPSPSLSPWCPLDGGPFPMELLRAFLRGGLLPQPVLGHNHNHVAPGFISQPSNPWSMVPPAAGSAWSLKV